MTTTTTTSEKNLVVDHASLEDEKVTERQERRRTSVKLSREQVTINVPVPQFVYACRLMAKNRDVQFLTAFGRVNISLDSSAVRAGNAVPIIQYRIERDWRPQIENRRLVILSVRICEQDARTFPVDFQLSLLGAPRPYVVQQRRHVSNLNVELISDGVAFMNEPCSLTFSSLDALDFFISTSETISQTADGHVVIPKCNQFAGLLREVVMARQLTRLDSLLRSCATRSMLTDAPLESTSAWIYTNPSAFFEAVEFIQEHLVPLTRRQLLPSHCDPGTFDARPLTTGTSWTVELSPHVAIDSPKRFDASVQFIVHLASVPLASIDKYTHL